MQSAQILLNAIRLMPEDSTAEGEAVAATPRTLLLMAMKNMMMALEAMTETPALPSPTTPPEALADYKDVLTNMDCIDEKHIEGEIVETAGDNNDDSQLKTEPIGEGKPMQDFDDTNFKVEVLETAGDGTTKDEVLETAGDGTIKDEDFDDSGTKSKAARPRPPPFPPSFPKKGPPPPPRHRPMPKGMPKSSSSASSTSRPREPLSPLSKRYRTAL
jgi:hypothetical protein